MGEIKKIICAPIDLVVSGNRHIQNTVGTALREKNKYSKIDT